MGKRGPHPKPPEQLAPGSSRAKERARNMPRPAPGIPTPPRWLNALGREAFRDVVRELAHMGLLARADHRLITRYAQLWSRWVKLERFISDPKNGSTCVAITREGNAKEGTRPQTIEAGILADKLLRIEQQLGLSPAARASLAVNPAGPAKGGAADGEAPGEDYYTA